MENFRVIAALVGPASVGSTPVGSEIEASGWQAQLQAKNITFDVVRDINR